MGKTPKKKKLSESGSINSLTSPRNSRCSGELMDEDDTVFNGLATDLKEEGTRLFQKRDYEGAAFKFDKAMKLLSKGHGDIAFLHCNIAACYMHMNPEEYHRAIDECNSALEAAPTYVKALLKRARCFEALDRLDLAFRDVEKVLSLEPNNVTALELYESMREVMEEEDLLEKKIGSQEDPAAKFAREWIQRKRRVSRKFRNSVVEEEVWEMIHEDEENHESDDTENSSKEYITENICEEDDTTEMQAKNQQDNHEKHNEDVKIKNHQYKKDVIDDGKHPQHALWDIEEIVKKQSRDKHEKHLKEILLKCIQHDHECHTRQNQVRNVEKGQTLFEVGSHSKQEKHTAENNEWHPKAKVQEAYSSERNIDHRADILEKQSTTRVVNQSTSKHKKYSSENHDDAIEGARRGFKFVLGDDVRVVLIPENCSLLQLMDIARYKYNPHLKSFLLKFMDKEGDMVTITSTEDLRWVEELYPQLPVRLYIKEVSPEREITKDLIMPTSSFLPQERNQYSTSDECGSSRKEEEKNCTVDDWMLQFARLFKNHAGFENDACVDLRDLGLRLYYEAMEDTITSEEAQEIFQLAEAKFQEMAALALFNWGNVHMARARKRLLLSEDASKESILSQVKDAYEWACTEYVKAGKKFEDSIDVKPDFYEGLIALGQQQFEQAKLSWRYADTCKVDMGTEVLELFNHAEDNMEKGMEMWEGIEYLRVKELSKSRKGKIVDKMALNEYGKDLSPDEAFEQASNMRSQLNISWGTILYERSVVEFRLGLSSWEESLQEAIEKFKTGGASLADISVMVKNHCVNQNTQEGLSFKIDEIVQAWNEMYDAKKLKNGSSSFRLEPFFRRRPSKLHNILEHIHSS